ncbi:MAG: hypothetical protein LBM70_07130 [Victivallales bacterium]|jgi:uncharacterized repeat protein (TIGR04138 family)|nr:hypothetical protein [Victivallales bacterium]
MNPAKIKVKIDAILKTEPRFAEAAYSFVTDAVTFTVERLPAHRHVSALELLNGVHDYAQKEFGVLGSQVLDQWGIRDASDVGKIVYLLIGSGLLSASKEDAPEDFNVAFPLFDEPDFATIETKPTIKII